ncbi:hypothetical protein FA15DRAFT_672429 [Coprinopsis marcescibilis]|uniref:Uncharacterized protein n=1 Tax=Coprinopsis marcescibilis TaxID=230819 RepID=A0A5C3KNG4_COPMA|nr:hypothetical protein FA15DRAFT_672429 [Coprinopsis marcescibilis]
MPISPSEAALSVSSYSHLPPAKRLRLANSIAADQRVTTGIQVIPGRQSFVCLDAPLDSASAYSTGPLERMPSNSNHREDRTRITSAPPEPSSIRYARSMAILRYTPPPSRRQSSTSYEHDQLFHTSGSTLAGSSSLQNRADEGTGEPDSPTRTHTQSDCPTSPSPFPPPGTDVEMVAVSDDDSRVSSTSQPQASPKILLKIRKSKTLIDPNVKPTSLDMKIEIPVAQEDQYLSSRGNNSKSTIDAHTRIKGVLDHLSKATTPMHTLDELLDNLKSGTPASSKARREDACIRRLSWIYRDYTDEDISEALKKRELLPLEATQTSSLEARFKELVERGPVDIKGVQDISSIEKILSTLREENEDLYRENYVVNWLDGVIGIAFHLIYSVGWNKLSKREKSNLRESDFKVIFEAEIAEWDEIEAEENFKAWAKHEEKFNTSRNQTSRLYNTFGAAVVAESNILRPLLTGEPIGRSPSFPAVVKEIEGGYRTLLKKRDILTLFPAYFWGDGFQEKDMDEDQLCNEHYNEWVTRSHNSSSRLIVSLVKAVVGEIPAQWVATFFKQHTPMGFKKQVPISELGPNA